MSDLPDFSLLTLHPRRELILKAPTGIYCINDISDLSQCKSSVILIRNALDVSDAEADELDAFMSDDDNVKPSRNAFNANAPPIARKQCTFGANYKDYDTIPGPASTWPTAVQKALDYSKRVVVQLGQDPNLFNAVHANLYPSGNAGVIPHRDDETVMIPGLPILSFTLLTGVKLKREFVIYRDESLEEFNSRLDERTRKYEASGKPLPKTPLKSKPVPIAEVLLGNNDLLIMQGDMQSRETGFLHGVPKRPESAFDDARRLNMTVRAFHEHAVATADAKRKAD